jgi:alanine racemase
MPNYRTWIEISRPAVKHNYKVFRLLVGKPTKLLGVVKSNAYGHELFGFANELQKLGVDFLGVDSITEALSLRKHGIKVPILVLGYTLPENFSQAHQKNISLAISTFESLNLLAKQKKSVSIHLKIDTGMHRQGFFVKDLPKVLSILKSSKQIKVDGVFTHFASAKRPDSSHETEKQIAEFKKSVVMVKVVYPKALAHASATAGILNYPEANFDMVRLGIGIYGL